MTTSPQDRARAEAERFHEAYERLAPSFLYHTREETRTFNPDTPNGRLMIAVCAELLASEPSEQPQQQGPVAWMNPELGSVIDNYAKANYPPPWTKFTIPLYAVPAPPQQERTVQHDDRIGAISGLILDKFSDLPEDDAWDLAVAIDAEFLRPPVPPQQDLEKRAEEWWEKEETREQFQQILWTTEAEDVRRIRVLAAFARSLPQQQPSVSVEEDWNTLMPIVERITQDKYEDGDTAYFRTLGMRDENNEWMARINRYSLHTAGTLFQAMRKAIAEYTEHQKSILSR